MHETDRSISGIARTTTEVLEGKKYSIDYYQREYKWEAKQLAELVADLTSRFLDIFDPAHARKDVANYPGYFLGSIVVSQKGTEQCVVDGQQRLTSVTLMLTYLRRLQQGRHDVVDVDKMIFSESYGEKSFNLDVPDRNECMKALFDHGEFEPPPGAPESVHTLVERYGEFARLFPDELSGDALPYFIDWLKGRVQLVQITAYTDDDAYSIFETMNDRGLRLAPADMLKGYLLSQIESGAARTAAGEVWRSRLQALEQIADDASSDFLKTWLRSQYADTIRDRSGGARPRDWDRIGTEFHRWLRENRVRVGLKSPSDFRDFLKLDFDFYTRQYERVLEVANAVPAPSDPLRFVRFNADHGFTLQDQILLAPLARTDAPAVIDAKLEIVGRFVDILLARRIWNFKSTAYSTMQYAMFTVMRDARRLDVADLAGTLHRYLARSPETFDSDGQLHVHQQNRRQIHKLLARMTDFVSVESGLQSNYVELANGGTVKYEVEHIWANRPDEHRGEFAHEADFARHRNLIGDLLLLPKQFNASYGAKSYRDKVDHYHGQNILAASLCALSYKNNPGFHAMKSKYGLPFTSYHTFTAADIVERGELYRAIAKRVWNADDLLEIATVV